MNKKEIKPCEVCGGNRWRTLVKGKKYLCRTIFRIFMGNFGKCENVRIV